MSAMAQGLFASLLIGTIISTLGTQLNIPILTDIGGYAKSAAGPAMAVAIGYALQAPPLVLFSLVAVGGASNTLGGAGGPLAVFFLAIIAAELGKLVSKKTKIDILVTPLVTILSGCLLAYFCAPYIGAAASSVGQLIMWATEQQPLLMGIVGFLGVLFFVGPLLDTCTVFLAPISMSLKSIMAIYISGFTVNISQGISTFIVMFLLGKPLLEKLDRIKVKYGMMEDEYGL